MFLTAFLSWALFGLAVNAQFLAALCVCGGSIALYYGACGLERCGGGGGDTSSDGGLSGDGGAPALYARLPLADGDDAFDAADDDDDVGSLELVGDDMGSLERGDCDYLALPLPADNKGNGHGAESVESECGEFESDDEDVGAGIRGLARIF